MKPTPTYSNELDRIQREIWARINDEINKRGIKIDVGDAYSLGSVIKEVLHPEVDKLISQATKAAELKGRIDEQNRTELHTYDDGTTVIRFLHPTHQYQQQDVRKAELKSQLPEGGAE